MLGKRLSTCPLTSISHSLAFFFFKRGPHIKKKAKQNKIRNKTMHMNVLTIFMSDALMPLEARRGIRFPWDWSYRSYELPRGQWKSNQGF